MTRQQPAAIRRLRPLQRRQRRGHHPPGPVREQRSGNRRRRWRRPGPHARPERRGGHHGPLPGPRRHLPRHGAAGRATPGLRLRRRRRWSISSPTRNGRSSALVPSELCSDEQFIRRVYLDLTGTLPTPAQVKRVRRRHRPDQARQAGRRAAGVRRSTAITSPTSGPTSSASSAAPISTDRAQGTFAFHGWIREAIAARQAL